MLPPEYSPNKPTRCIAVFGSVVFRMVLQEPGCSTLECAPTRRRVAALG